MSSPIQVNCTCGHSFIMLERTGPCLKCGKGWASHRATPKEIAKAEKAEDV